MQDLESLKALRSLMTIYDITIYTDVKDNIVISSKSDDSKHEFRQGFTYADVDKKIDEIQKQNKELLENGI